MGRRKVELTEKMKINIKNVIKTICNENGISQEELANRIHCTPFLVSRMKNGKCGMSVATADAIIKAFPDKAYKKDWLRGLNPYKSAGDEFRERWANAIQDYNEEKKVFEAVASMMGSCGLVWDGDATARIRPASDGPIEYEGIRCEYAAPHTVDYQGETFETWELAAIARKVFSNLQNELDFAVMVKKMQLGKDIVSRQPVELRFGGRD